MMHVSKPTSLALSVFALFFSAAMLLGSESYLASFWFFLFAIFPIYAVRREDEALTLFSLVFAFAAVLINAIYFINYFSDKLVWFALSLLLCFSSFFQFIFILDFWGRYRNKNVIQNPSLQIKNVLHLLLTYSLPLLYVGFQDAFLSIKFIWILIPVCLLMNKRIRRHDPFIMVTFGVGSLLAGAGLFLGILASSASVFDPDQDQLHLAVALPGALYFAYSAVEHSAVVWRSFKNLFLRVPEVEIERVEEKT